MTEEERREKRRQEMRKEIDEILERERNEQWQYTKCPMNYKF
jgi:hypothetical protein